MSVVVLAESKQTGNPGGSLAGEYWNTRDLNTVLSDSVTWCSLNSSNSQFTLKTGKYLLTANAVAMGVGSHKLRIRNVSDNSCCYGISSLSDSLRPDSSGGTTLVGYLNVSQQRSYVLEHYAERTSANIGKGFPVNSGTDEIYSTLTIHRV